MRPHRWLLFVALLSSGFAGQSPAQDDPKPESAYVKLLKKAPEERVGQIVEIIGKRGTADDLTVVYQRALKPDRRCRAHSPASTHR